MSEDKDDLKVTEALLAIMEQARQGELHNQLVITDQETDLGVVIMYLVKESDAIRRALVGGESIAKAQFDAKLDDVQKHLPNSMKLAIQKGIDACVTGYQTYYQLDKYKAVFTFCPSGIMYVGTYEPLVERCRETIEPIHTPVVH